MCLVCNTVNSLKTHSRSYCENVCSRGPSACEQLLVALYVYSRSGKWASFTHIISEPIKKPLFLVGETCWITATVALTICRVFQITWETFFFSVYKTSLTSSSSFSLGSGVKEGVREFMSQTVKPLWPTNFNMKWGSAEAVKYRSAEFPCRGNQDVWPDAACLDTKLDLVANLFFLV